MWKCGSDIASLTLSRFERKGAGNPIQFFVGGIRVASCAKHLLTQMTARERG